MPGTKPQRKVAEAEPRSEPYSRFFGTGAAA